MILDYHGPTTDGDGRETVNAAQHRGAAYEGRTNAQGRALAQMLRGWEAYAEAYQDTYDGQIGEDGVIGPYWAHVGLAIKRLLDGDTGGLDAGSIAANILVAIQEQGIPTD